MHCTLKVNKVFGMSPSTAATRWSKWVNELCSSYSRTFHAASDLQFELTFVYVSTKGFTCGYTESILNFQSLAFFGGYARDALIVELREFQYILIHELCTSMNACQPLGNNQQHQFIHLFNWRTIASHRMECLVLICVRAIARVRMYIKIVWKLKWDFNDKMNVNMTTSNHQNKQTQPHTQSDNHKRMR